MALALDVQHAWAKTARGMLLKGEFTGSLFLDMFDHNKFI
jgi:hypothetical protein